MKLAITGATGFVGQHLLKSFSGKHEITLIVRDPAKIKSSDHHVYTWDQLPQALKGVDAVIHLAGESVSKKWTDEAKIAMYDSRIKTSEQIVSAISQLGSDRPQVFISASAVGFYGDRGDEVLTEKSPKGTGFLADLVSDWENAVQKAGDLGVRSVQLRFGIVLGEGGGVLKRMKPVVLGDGRQWVSWIHVQDVVRGIEFALTHHQMSGAYNLTSPIPLTNGEFAKALGKAHHFPLTPHVPTLALRMVLGEMSQLILASQRVLPQRLKELGFSFVYPDLNDALEEINNAAH